LAAIYLVFAPDQILRALEAAPADVVVGVDFNWSSDEARFYKNVLCRTRLVAAFDAANGKLSSWQNGVPIGVYRLTQSPSRHDLLCHQRVTN
jgi:hypothetical protein